MLTATRPAILRCDLCGEGVRIEATTADTRIAAHDHAMDEHRAEWLADASIAVDRIHVVG